MSKVSKVARLDLMTTDAAGAAAFYGRVFGWQSRVEATTDGGAYTWLTGTGGEAVGGLYEMTADLRRQGVSAHWCPQVAVADADAAVALARELGAKISSAGFPLLGAGTLALIQDPSGAPLGLWASASGLAAAPVAAGAAPGAAAAPGAGAAPIATAAPGAGAAAPSVTALFWPELSTTDVPKALRFYHDFLGWRVAPDASDAAGYQFLHAGADDADAILPVAGVLPIAARFRGIPSHWLVYVDVPGCEVVAATCTVAGGRVLAPPHVAAGVGIQAVIQDPQGAVIGILERES